MLISLTQLRQQLALLTEDSKKSRFSLRESTLSSSPFWMNCLPTSFVQPVTVHRLRHIQTPYWFGKLFLATVDGRKQVVGDDAIFFLIWKKKIFNWIFFSFFAKKDQIREKDPFYPKVCRTFSSIFQTETYFELFWTSSGLSMDQKVHNFWSVFMNCMMSWNEIFKRLRFLEVKLIMQ